MLSAYKGVDLVESNMTSKRARVHPVSDQGSKGQAEDLERKHTAVTAAKKLEFKTEKEAGAALTTKLKEVETTSKRLLDLHAGEVKDLECKHYQRTISVRAC